MIVNDLFMVKPISSITGYITYMQFGLGEEKGGVGGLDANGEFNTPTQDPFVWAPMTEARVNYSGEKVSEAVAAAGAVTVGWTPVRKGQFENAGVKYDAKVVQAAGTIAYVYADAAGKLFTDAACTTAFVGAVGDKVYYSYDNQMIPQAKLPTLVGKMKGISVAARARRIAISYSQFSAFVSKNDYGINLISSLA